MNRRAPLKAQAPAGPGRAAPAAPLTVLPRQRYTDLNQMALKLRLGSFTAEMLGWGFIDGTRWWRNYLHVHSHFEICYAFSGRGTFRMLGLDYPVKRGDVFIAKPREEHEIVADERDPLGIYFWSHTLVREGESPVGARVFGRPEKTSRESGSMACGAEAIDRLLHAFVDSKSWVSARVPGMERTLELLTEEIVRSEPGHAQVLEGLAAKLILDTARAGAGAPLPGEDTLPRSTGSAQACVAQALRYMRDNLGRNLSIREIAAQMNLSARHFSRLFRQGSGQSPLDALTGIRVETAAQLLLDRMLPIKAIAERTGFPDVRYFTTVFRKQTGLPPAAFRAKGGTRFRDPARGSRGKPGHVVARSARRKFKI